jgi:N-sulfoglucosamine sulfohydrolase
MKEGTPTLPALLREAGYLTGNIHKRDHMLPLDAFNWVHDNESLGLLDPDSVVGRDPQAIAGGLHRFIQEADEKQKSFFMVVNSADSHRPFHGDSFNKNTIAWGNGKVEINLKDPSRIYKPEEVVIPPTLPDLPEIRNDLAKYASSARRLDDTVGACLNVLDQLGKKSSTLVIFVSDNGMPLPYAKFDCYMGSNRSPFLMRWPEVIKKPIKNKEALVSLMDITPTVLELAKLPIPTMMDGKSLVAFIKNKNPKDWRKSIVFIRNEDIYYGDGLESVLKRDPDYGKKMEKLGWLKRPDHEVPGSYSRSKEIRTYYDGQYGYIYNNCYKEKGLELSPLGVIVAYNGASIRAMKKASRNDGSLKKRYKSFLLRAEEELYDWNQDPGSKHNLAKDPKYADIMKEARKGLHEYMKSANDPLTDIYKDFIKRR